MGAPDLADVVVVEDGDRIRIVRYTLAPGQSTGWHRHAHDYVIVPYADCRVRVETTEGVIEAEMWRDRPYFRGKGVEHTVTSLMEAPLSFLEIEIK